MDDKGLLMLARLVLSKKVLDYFPMTNIEYVDTKRYYERWIEPPCPEEQLCYLSILRSLRR